MRNWLKRTCERGDDSARLVAVLGIIFFLVYIFILYPIYDAINQKVVFARDDRLRAETEAKFEEWNKQTDDEKFAWCVMDMAEKNEAIVKVDIDDARGSIYIKCYTKKSIFDDLTKEKEYLKTMTEFARGSNVTKDIFLQGWNDKKEVVWMIDEYGNVF